MNAGQLDDFDIFCRIANSSDHSDHSENNNLLRPEPYLNRRKSRSVKEPRSRRGSTWLGDDSDIRITRRGSLKPDLSPNRLGQALISDSSNSAAAGSSEDMTGNVVRVRSFKRTSKGVVNKGDTLRVDDLPSIALETAPSNEGSPCGSRRGSCHRGSIGCAGYLGESLHPEMCRQRSHSCSRVVPDLKISTDSIVSGFPFQIQVIGAEQVGKTSLCTQFSTSESLVARDSAQNEDEVKIVTVEVDGEESRLIFIDPEYSEQRVPTNVEILEDSDAYLVVYALDDRDSFDYADRVLNGLFGETRKSAVILLVATKSDLVRGREVTTDEGKKLALVYGCKYMEVSTTLNHKVDDLLVNIVTQIRHQQHKVEKEKLKLDRKRRGSFRSSLRVHSTKNMVSKFIKKHFNKSAEEVFAP